MSSGKRVGNDIRKDPLSWAQSREETPKPPAVQGSHERSVCRRELAAGSLRTLNAKTMLLRDDRA